MGTNYYLPVACPNACAHCTAEDMHIGKRSGGWTFAFEAHPDEGLTTRAAWRKRIRLVGRVVDEYGQEFTPDEFDALVDQTREPWGPNKIEPRRRDEGSDWRIYRDPEGWDFWTGWSS